MKYRRVPQSFFIEPTLKLAKKLLGTILVHVTEEGTTAGMIVETEAYIGPWDKAAHSYNNRLTQRTKVMFGPPGHAYIYTVYGLHNCFNVVSGRLNEPEAVLIRALEPVDGVDLMKKRRRTENVKLLTNGPGRLTQAMGITKAQYGWNLSSSPLYIAYGRHIHEEQIACGRRIGIDYAEEAADFLWRFWVAGNEFVSK